MYRYELKQPRMIPRPKIAVHKMRAEVGSGISEIGTREILVINCSGDARKALVIKISMLCCPAVNVSTNDNLSRRSGPGGLQFIRPRSMLSSDTPSTNTLNTPASLQAKG